jgi:DNA-binding CsgD family transcriptional regulator
VDTTGDLRGGETSAERALIGRAAECRALALALERAAAGDGAIVLVVGDAGMGKTTLLEHAIARARAANLRTAWATVPDAEGSPPFWPWTVILHDLAVGAEDAVLPAAADALTAPDETAASSEQARFRAFDQVLRALRALAAPALVVLDDLHRADGGTLRLLEFLAPQLRRSGLVLALGARPAPAGSDLAASFGALVRAGATRIDLRPWTEGETAAALARCGVAAAWPAVEALRRDTGGNPFYVLELARGARRADGTVDLRRVPTTIIEVLSAEARRLDAVQLDILRLASAWGQGAPLDLLAAAGPALSTVARSLPESFLSVDRGGAVWFRHDLVREAVYQGVPEHERVHLHARLAEVIEQSSLAPEDRVRHLAVHGCRAGPAWRPEVAFAAAREAAANAAAMHAVESAAAYLELADGVRRWCAPDAARDLALLVTYGDILTRAGDRDGARSVLAEAVTLARRAGDVEALARVALVIGLGTETAGTPDVEAWRLLDEALEKLPRDAHLLRARLLARKTWQAIAAADTAQYITCGREAVAEARASGSHQAIAQALDAYIVTLIDPDSMYRQEVAREITACATLAGDIDLQFSGLLWEAHTGLESGDVAAVRDAARRYREMAERWPLPYHAWYRWVIDATLAFLDDRLDDAAVAIARLDPESTSQREFAALLRAGEEMELAARRGDRAAFESAGAAALALSRGSPLFDAVQAHYDACLGRRDAASRALDRVVETLAQGPRDNDWPAVLTEAALAAIRLEARTQAIALFERIEPYRGCWDLISNASVPRGPIAGILAGLARLIGDADGAAALEAEARTAVRRAGTPGALFWIEGGPRWSPAGGAPAGPAGLSAREREVLALLAAGCSNQEIADRLVLSVRTVQRHVENIYAKTGARGRAAASVFAAAHGLVAPDA